jgi:hypothetical protein
MYHNLEGDYVTVILTKKILWLMSWESNNERKGEQVWD